MPGASAHPAGAGCAFAYVGCFTTPRRGGSGDGIAAFRVGPDEAWTPAGAVPGLVNPSFLCAGPDRRTLYVGHADLDAFSWYGREPETGALRLLGRTGVGGANIVHAAIVPDRRTLLTANYASGSVTLLRLDDDGGVEARVQVLALPGRPGPNRDEQRGSHPHQILLAPEPSFVLVPDKGHDAVHILQFEPDGRLSLRRSVPASPGAGPRHGAFHPTRPICWVVNELHSTVTTFGWSAGDGGLEPLATVSLLPDGFDGVNAASAIAVSACGGFVFASNRGHDSVAAFAVAPDGRLRAIGWTPTGRKPRFLLRVADRLLVAAEADGRIDIFAIGSDGRLGPALHSVSTPSPASVAWVADE